MDINEKTAQRSGRMVCQKPELTLTPKYPPVSLDTRMELAVAGMDAILAHNHGVTLAEAHDAVRRAQEAPELLTEDEPKRPPHPVLAMAAGVIRAQGWTRDEFFTERGGAVCALAAIRVAVYGEDWPRMVLNNPDEDSATAELMTRIQAEVGHDRWSIPQWNDHQDSQDAVLKLLY